MSLTPFATIEWSLVDLHSMLWVSCSNCPTSFDHWELRVVSWAPLTCPSLLLLGLRVLFLIFVFCCCFETGLEHSIIMPQSPQCWDHRYACVLPHHALMSKFSLLCFQDTALSECPPISAAPSHLSEATIALSLAFLLTIPSHGSSAIPAQISS